MFPVSDISDVDYAFPAHVLGLMPEFKNIPEKYKDGNTPANAFVNMWFYSGVKGLRATPREGVDGVKAMRHLSAIMRSFEPKHEHKEAACAFLLDEWFSDYQGEPATERDKR